MSATQGRILSYNALLNHNPLRLQRLPLPSLSDTLHRWLKSASPLCKSQSEYDASEQAINGFLRGSGPLLQQHIELREKGNARRRGYPCSYVEDIMDDVILRSRTPLPVYSNAYLGFKRHSSTMKFSDDPQVSVAAALTHSYLKHVQNVLFGRLHEPPEPICLYQQAAQISEARVPMQRRDRVTTSEGSSHMIILSGGSMFSLEVRDGRGRTLSVEGLARALEDVKSRSCQYSNRSVTMLTGANREEWANARAQLEKTGNMNWKALHAIDSSLLVLALDTEDTEGWSAQTCTTVTAEKFLLGPTGGEGRWFDRHNIVVLSNGEAAINFERSFSDEPAWSMMMQEIWNDITAQSRNGGQINGPQSPSSHQNLCQMYQSVETFTSFSSAKELCWELPSDFQSYVSAAQGCRKLQKDHHFGIEVLEFLDLGKLWSEPLERKRGKARISRDAIIQLAIQLAHYRLHGTMPAIRGTCSMNRFLHGRMDTLRSCTSASAAFVSAVENGGMKGPSLCSMLFDALETHTALLNSVTMGEGIDNHLLSLKEAARERDFGEGDELWNLPTYIRAQNWNLSTTCMQSQPYLTHFSASGSELKRGGLSCSYSLQDDRVDFTIASMDGQDQVNAFAEEVKSSIPHVLQLVSLC